MDKAKNLGHTKNELLRYSSYTSIEILGIISSSFSPIYGELYAKLD